MHHAYVIVGEETEAVQYLEKTFAITALLRHFPLLGIEEGRMIKMEQSRRLAPEKKSFIVLSCDTITIEAQNVLLKTFEALSVSERRVITRFYSLISKTIDESLIQPGRPVRIGS